MNIDDRCSYVHLLYHGSIKQIVSKQMNILFNICYIVSNCYEIFQQSVNVYLQTLFLLENMYFETYLTLNY